MTDPPINATEGVATNVICFVFYKCKKNLKAIVWNYKDMQSSGRTDDLPNNAYKTSSNLTFIGSLEDIGKLLTCTAHFRSGETSKSSTILVKSEFPHT